MFRKKLKDKLGKTPQKSAASQKNVAAAACQLDPVEVYGRIRPISEDVAVCVKVLDSTSIQLSPPEESHAGKNGVVKESQYSFKHVFDENSSQSAVFERLGLPCVEDVLRGKNALLFAYGITSSGKTHTMAGPSDDQGILPRCLDVIFNSIDKLQANGCVFKPDKTNGYDVQTEADAAIERQMKDRVGKGGSKAVKFDLDTLSSSSSSQSSSSSSQSSSSRVCEDARVKDVEEDNNYAVFVSYVEVYNNYLFDLLEEASCDSIARNKPPASKILREDSKRNIYVSGVTEMEVKSTEEAYAMLIKGQKRRKVAHTALNAESSRSHSVFSVRLVQAPLDPLGEEVLQDKEKIVVSQLSLVDLAGSERSKRTHSHGERLKEASSINQSLMALRSCIEALRDNQRKSAPTSKKIVPYRESRLTHLFKTHFEGEGRVRMIVCINPKATEYDETVQVMSFAELTQEVQVVRASQQLVLADAGLAKGRRRRNQEYKAALSKAQEEDGINLSEDIPLPNPLAYSMDDLALPSVEMSHWEEGYVIDNLVEVLQERMKRRETLLEDYGSKQKTFRDNLVVMEQETVDLKAEVKDLRSKVGSKNSETERLKRKIRSLEKTNDELVKSNTVYKRENQKLERQMDDQAHVIRRERGQLEQNYRARVAQLEHQTNKEIANTKRKLREEADTEAESQRAKMQKLHHVVGDVSESENLSMPPPKTPPPAFRARVVTFPNTFTPVTSKPPVSKQSRQVCQSLPRPSRKSFFTPVKQFATKTRLRTSPPPKPKTAFVPRYALRSTNGVGSDSENSSSPPSTPDTVFTQSHKPVIIRKTSINQQTVTSSKFRQKVLSSRPLTTKQEQICSNVPMTPKNKVKVNAQMATRSIQQELQVSASGRKRHMSENTSLEDSECERTADSGISFSSVLSEGSPIKRFKTSQV